MTSSNDTTHDSPSTAVAVRQRFGQLEPLQEHFLSRLLHLTTLHHDALGRQPRDEAAVKLLSKAIYATYLDCVGVNVGDQAQALMDPALHQT